MHNRMVQNMSFFFLVCFFLHAPVFGQSDGCKGLSEKAVFRVLHSSRTLVKRELQLQIYVSPKLFEIETMVAVRRQIRDMFCNEEFLLVSIFDTSKPPVDSVLDPLERRSGARALYVLTEESDRLSFRHSNGSEIELRFSSSNNYCVLADN